MVSNCIPRLTKGPLRCLKLTLLLFPFSAENPNGVDEGVIKPNSDAAAWLNYNILLSGMATWHVDMILINSRLAFGRVDI